MLCTIDRSAKSMTKKNQREAKNTSQKQSDNVRVVKINADKIGHQTKHKE